MTTTYETDVRLKIRDVARMSGFSEKTVWRYIDAGLLKVRQPGGPGTKVFVMGADYLDWFSRMRPVAEKLEKMYSGPVVRPVQFDLRDVWLNSPNPAMRALAEAHAA